MRTTVVAAGNRRDRRHWTLEEARWFLAARQQDPMLPVWRLALDTGLRRDELTALAWSDVDLKGGAVRVRNPKGQSTRRVYIASSTVTALRRLAMQQLVAQLTAGALWVGGSPGSTGPLVVGPLGNPLSRAALTRAFRQAQRGLDIPEIPLHGLRFTSARIAFAAGTTVMTIAERLGHLDAGTMLEVWPHLLDPGSGDEPEGGIR